MNLSNVIQCLVYLAALLFCVKPLGIYMARVYEGESVGLNKWFGPVERGFYKLCGVKPEDEMS